VTHRADVVVMGAVSRSRFEEIFVGSTAERVLDRIASDVLVVKPPDFADQMPV
jgi:universal stress protein E